LGPSAEGSERFNKKKRAFNPVRLPPLWLAKSSSPAWFEQHSWSASPLAYTIQELLRHSNYKLTADTFSAGIGGKAKYLSGVAAQFLDYDNDGLEESNFFDYQLARMNDAPRQTDVHIVESSAPPAGVDEPGVPLFVPALCNALFAATGKRVRELPLTRNGFS
jgi:hypothetical protein